MWYNQYMPRHVINLQPNVGVSVSEILHESLHLRQLVQTSAHAGADLRFDLLLRLADEPGMRRRVAYRGAINTVKYTC